MASRHVKLAIQLTLVARSAGRCEFRGCNELLFEHHLTKEDGNFAELAHIVAFREGGPRGRGQRPPDINTADNLMLLCPHDHKRIDDAPADYPRAVLEAMKREHERRVVYQTSLGPEAASTVLTLRAPIGGHPPDPISRAEVFQAMRPLGRYPAERDACEISVMGSHDANAGFYQSAADQIDRQLALLQTGAAAPRHLSVFAFAPIPLLVHLGSRVSNKLGVEIFQRHRAGHPWRWRGDGPIVEFAWRCLRAGTDREKVGLLISVSGSVELDTLPAEVDASFSLYEIHPLSPPGRDLIRRRDDLARFRQTYRAALESILAAHGTLDVLHLFPAVPLSVGVVLGHDILPKAYPKLWVYDHRRPEGFTLAHKVLYAG